MNKNNALVLLGGMMCDERLWAHQRAVLDIEFDSVVIGDLTRSSTIAGMASDVLSAAPERFALAGLSLGGMVAFELWRQAPARITHLGLLDTNPFAEKPERQLKRDEEMLDAKAGRLQELMVEQFKPKYLGARARRDADILDLILDMAMSLGTSVFERQSVALRDRPESCETLATISCPSLIACGAEDVLCPPKFHEYMAETMPNATLEVIDDCGHMAPLEKPDAVTRLLREMTSR